MPLSSELFSKRKDLIYQSLYAFSTTKWMPTKKNEAESLMEKLVDAEMYTDGNI
jgi:hypothetical protein